MSPAWSSDGQTIYVSQLASRRSMSGNVALWAYPVDGGEPKEISTPDMGRGSMLVSTFPPGAYGPQPLAKSDELFFTAAAPRQHGDTTGPRAEIMKVNLQSGRTDPVSSTPMYRWKLNPESAPLPTLGRVQKQQGWLRGLLSRPTARSMHFPPLAASTK